MGTQRRFPDDVLTAIRDGIGIWAVVVDDDLSRVLKLR